MAGINQGAAKDSPFLAACEVGDADFIIAAQVSTTRNVAVQLKNAGIQAMQQRGAIRAYLSDNADGSTLTAVTPTTVAIGTNGLAIVLVTGKVFELITNASGQVDLTITKNSANTYYLVLILPTGTLKISGAIALA